MSNLSWCDLNNKGSLSEVHNMCTNPNRKFQKHIFFTPNQFQLEESDFKNTMKDILQHSQKG